jgi:hypothetical protein
MNRAMVALTLALTVALAVPAGAQYPYPPPDAPPPPGALPPGMPPAGAPPPPPAQALYAPPQLDQMLASIALYPDPLLTALLTASTYPIEVVDADRWVSAPENAALSDGALASAVEAQGWDPSVKSLVPFPQILHMLDAHLDWTQALGNAFLAQQADVMDSIQRLRHDALAAGTLRSTPQQAVIVAGAYIQIEPVNPDLVAIPVYNPTMVYGQWPYPAYLPIYYGPPPGLVYQVAPAGIGFGVGIVVVDVLWRWGHWDWQQHRIDLDRDRFNRLNAGRPPVAATVWHHDATRRATFERGTGGARPLGATQPPRQANVPPAAAPSQGRGPQPTVPPPQQEQRREQEQRHEQSRVPAPGAVQPAAPAAGAPAAPTHPVAPTAPAVVRQEPPHEAHVPPPQGHPPQQPPPPAVQPMQQAPVQPMRSSPVQPPQAAAVPPHANPPPHPAAKPPAPEGRGAAEAAPPGQPERHEERHE